MSEIYPGGPQQAFGGKKNPKDKPSDHGAWKITIFDPDEKEPAPKILYVVAASLKDIVNTYDNVIQGEFLGEGGVVFSLQLSQSPDGQIVLKPQEAL